MTVSPGSSPMLDRNAPAPMLGLDMEVPFAFVAPEEAHRIAEGERVAKEMEDAPPDPAWEKLISATFGLFDRPGDEKSERVRRALHDLVGPFVPPEVWNLSTAIGYLLTGMLYATRPGSGERRRRLLAAVFKEASIVKKELAE